LSNIFLHTSHDESTHTPRSCNRPTDRPTDRPSGLNQHTRTQTDHDIVMTTSLTRHNCKLRAPSSDSSWVCHLPLGPSTPSAIVASIWRDGIYHASVDVLGFGFGFTDASTRSLDLDRQALEVLFAVLFAAQSKVTFALGYCIRVCRMSWFICGPKSC
jgi:hypothetical protein